MKNNDPSHWQNDPSHRQQNAQRLLLSRVSPGEHLVLNISPGQQLAFAFDPLDSTMSRQDNGLLFTLNDGGRIFLANLFELEELPAVLLPDGRTMVGDDFFDFQALDMNTGNPATTVAEEAAVQENAVDLDTLVQGVNRLGAMGSLYWGESLILPPRGAEDTDDLLHSFAPAVGATLEPHLEAGDNVGVLSRDNEQMNSSGNVLSDALYGSAGGAMSFAATEAVDYHSQGLDFQVTRFCLNGQWYKANGETLAWQDGEGQSFNFRMDADGQYSLNIAAPGNAPAQALDVMYEIQSADGLMAQAELHIRQEEHIFRPNGNPGALLLGSIGDDVLFSGEDGGLVAGGAGNDILYGDIGADTFIWRGDDYDGSLDRVKNFSLEDGDKLRFEGLLDDSGPEELLNTGVLSLSSRGDTLLLDINPASGGAVSVEVNVHQGQLAAFTSAYTESNGSADGLDLALLKVLLDCN